MRSPARNEEVRGAFQPRAPVTPCGKRTAFVAAPRTLVDDSSWSRRCRCRHTGPGIGTTYRAAIGTLHYSLFAALIYCELVSEGSFGDNDVGVTLADADTEIFRTSPGISGVVSVACSVMEPSLDWRKIS